jgi:hypothetical protein
VFSMVATVAPSANVASAQTGGINSWVRHDLPTTLKHQMFPNSHIWDLTAADDGTLFALVEDTSGVTDGNGQGDLDQRPNLVGNWNGLRWAVFPAYSDVALFKSTDGGYTWTLVWHQPASDDAAPIAVVPQPGYVDGDSANSVVFIATGVRNLANIAAAGPNLVGNAIATPAGAGNLYRSFNGGDDFTRVTPRNPAVTLAPNGGVITSMDVGENVNAPGTYFALVGVASPNNVNGFGEGVYTWNEDDDRDWKDQQVSTATPPGPIPGTLPANNGVNVWGVLVSPNYMEDQTFVVAVYDDGSGFGSPGADDYVCFWDGRDGIWGGDVDSVSNARLGTIAQPKAPMWHATMAVPDDYSNGNNVFVGIDGTGGSPASAVLPNALADDVWRINGRTTVTGPSAAATRGVPFGVLDPNIFDITFVGSAGTGALFVGMELPESTYAANPREDGQAQVLRGESMTLWPSWTPAFKPPSGAWPVMLAEMGDTLMAAGGGDGWTTGGVHRCAAGCAACPGARMVFNGVGLMDDIAVSEDIPGYVNGGQWPTGVPLMQGTSWCLAEAVAEEVSPTYATDNLMYASTFSSWNHSDTIDQDRIRMANLSLWRWTDGMHWERILYEHLTMPTAGPGGIGNAQYRGKPMLTIAGQGYFYNDWTWWPRVSDGFSEDPYVFLLGGRGDSDLSGNPDVWEQEMLWYSNDLGDTWMNVAQMPIGAINNLVAPWSPWSNMGLSETGWWVETNQVVFLGDIAGWIYKTTDRGASWSEGALTALGLEISSIITSPIYSETGESDKVVLIGTFDGEPRDVFGLATQLGLGTLPPADLKSEVWISQDGCEQDLENVGAELDTDPAWTGSELDTPFDSRCAFGGPVVNFDIDCADPDRLDRYRPVPHRGGPDRSFGQHLGADLERRRLPGHHQGSPAVPVDGSGSW